MQIIKAGYEIMDPLDGRAILQKIEKIGRVCYKSEDKITENSCEKFVAGLIKRGHEAMLEHFSFSVKFIVDRGVSHELVRHRVASFAQESTRYCNYGKSGEVTFIKPFFFTPNTVEYDAWEMDVRTAEGAYLDLLDYGVTPQEARAVLPNSLKTEVVMTANLREWRHFFKLRAVGVTGAPHPQMMEVTVPLLKELQEIIPVVFEDLKV
jgi:thymidylate synthase (FAD)